MHPQSAHSISTTATLLLPRFYDRIVKCSCCGEERDPSTVVALPCNDDVRVCHGCISWLREQTGMLDVTPTLPTRDMNEAVEFYERAGFDVRLYEGGDYAFVTHGDQSVFDVGWEDGFTSTSARAGCS